MTAIAGKTGTVDGSCNEVKGWEITITTDMLDATDFCSNGYREYVEGLTGATGTITSTEPYTGSSSITLSNSEGGYSISGDVLWNEQSISNMVDGIIEYTNSFTFTGVVGLA